MLKPLLILLLLSSCCERPPMVNGEEFVIYEPSNGAFKEANKALEN